MLPSHQNVNAGVTDIVELFVKLRENTISKREPKTISVLFLREKTLADH